MKENRASRRFVFSKGREIRARLKAGDSMVEARVLNVSCGGLGLAAGKSEQQKLGQQCELLLDEVSSGSGLSCLKGQKLRIKWVLDYAQLANLGIGCEFVNPDPVCLEEIEALFEGAAV